MTAKTSEGKLRLGIVFGGASTEHLVSVRSASAVLAALDRERFEPVPLGVTRAGLWLTPGESVAALEEITRGAPECLPPPQIQQSSGRSDRLRAKVLATLEELDAVFPLIHGSTGEDGRLQGMLELLGLPYVGAGVGASAVAMDKALSKRLLSVSGIPVVPHVVARAAHWRSAPDEIVREAAELGCPLFAKPSNGGSSVGISKIHDREEIAGAVDEALRHDGVALIEQGIDGRELECAVLGNDAPQTAPVGEIRPAREFYDFIAKYEDAGTELIVPAELDAARSAELQAMAVAAFEALGCRGMARVDFFLEESGRVWLSEINTIPGFTGMSMYPRMWDAAGLPFPALIDRLVELALEGDPAAGESQGAGNGS